MDLVSIHHLMPLPEKKKPPPPPRLCVVLDVKIYSNRAYHCERISVWVSALVEQREKEKFA